MRAYGLRLTLFLFLIAVAGVDTSALMATLGEAEVGRAVALARWPATDVDRERFHRPYIFVVNQGSIPVTVERVEVITPFRRLELIAEEHARLNDLFGRGGLRDAQGAIRPWQGKVAVKAVLAFSLLNTFVDVPPVEVILDGRELLTAMETRRDAIVSMTGDASTLTGGTIEAIFDAESVGQTIRQALVAWNGKELARVTIDFVDLY